LSGSNSDITHVTRNQNGTYKITDVYNLIDYYYKFSTEHDALKLNSLKNVNEILLNEKEVYISTNNFIHQIDFYKLKDISCYRYKTCEECIKNANCKWETHNCKTLNNMFHTNRKCSNSTSISSTIILKGEINQTLILRCNLAEKNEILWKKNKILLQKDDSNYLTGKSNELIILNLRIENIGIYSCFDASNDDLNFNIYNLTIKNYNKSSNKIQNFKEVKQILDYFKNFTTKLNRINFC
jgi:hypothetical protein